ncbi:rhodanese-like domain-containing protein [Arcobacter sp. FWKO B]|uniref:rhodanese-like domain-containing protein n=1 Tax=Arcobacter sp. FWKO B TaxID=2593672 RepID=UPI0018A637C2|nr:rhodanese-like domain-containing protein [Arcobacter sp. FWKO B]QOG12584.1 rhodanese-like domain-containing protein [Arcobacter sp. FWKO B]
MKKITSALVVSSLLLTAGFAAEPKFKDYRTLTKELQAENKKNGTYATIEEVKAALASKEWIVADVRTMDEWAAAQIQGSVRIGRESPEVALENFVLDMDGNFIKPKMIVVCNSAARASIEAEAFRKMGFTEVKIFDIYQWIDKCNPVVTNYSMLNDKGGSGLKFGEYKAQHCYK